MQLKKRYKTSVKQLIRDLGPAPPNPPQGANDAQALQVSLEGLLGTFNLARFNHESSSFNLSTNAVKATLSPLTAISMHARTALSLTLQQQSSISIQQAAIASGQPLMDTF